MGVYFTHAYQIALKPKKEELEGFVIRTDAYPRSFSVCYSLVFFSIPCPCRFLGHLKNFNPTNFYKDFCIVISTYMLLNKKDR